jgi:hypothetical protein
MERARPLIPLVIGAALIESMSDMAGRPDRRPTSSPRKSASPVKKSKRKMAQASRKRNR